jgi:hypothetical protein
LKLAGATRDRLDFNELCGTVVVVTELRRAYPPRWVRRSQHLQRISVRLHPQLKSSLRVQRSNLAPIEPPWHEIASSPPAPRNDPDQILVEICSKGTVVMEIRPIISDADYCAALTEVEHLWDAESGTLEGD